MSLNLNHVGQATPAVRTKYDRMFQRKNQNVLSSHYTKLIERDGFGNEDDPDEEDFITLKRADHDLEDDIPPINHEAELSKRKLKMSRTKRMIAKSGSNTKLIYDDEGKPHALYELQDGQEWLAEKGLEGAKEEGQKFAQAERSKMEVANVLDKAEAKEKKREKKRKRKERERMMSGAKDAPVLDPISDDDGYVSPEFDLPDTDEEEEREFSRGPAPQKRGASNPSPPPTKKRKVVEEELEDEEELALRLLRKR